MATTTAGARYYVTGGADPVKAYLESLGADFREKIVSVHDLTPGWDVQNPCRDGAAIIDVSVAYGEKMERGSQAPPAIVIRTAAGYNILDGRQRVYASWMLGDEHFAAYELINPSPKLERIVAIGANANLNGIRPSQEFLIREVLQFGATYGASVATMAEMAGVGQKVIKDRLKALEVREKLQSRGLDAKDMPVGSVAALSSLLDDMDALKKVYQAIEASRATVQMTTALVKDVKQANGRGRNEVIDRFLHRNEVQSRIRRRKRTRSPMERMFTGLRSLRSTLRRDFDEISQEMSDSDRQEMITLVKYIQAKARQLCGQEVSR